MKFRQKRSTTLDLALALQRELIGRAGSWEPNFLPRPFTPETDLFRAGLTSWARTVGSGLPAFLAAARRPEDLLTLVDDERLRPGTELVTTALTAAAPTLTDALPLFEEVRKQAVVEVNDFLAPERYLAPLCAALGTVDTGRTLDLHLVPLAPYPPATGFLTAAGKATGVYADCRRFRGSTLADAVLTMLGWAQLKSGNIPESHLSTELVRRMPGGAPYQRRLRVILTKILVEVTAGHLVRAVDAAHRPCADVLGTKWRYPRLHAVAERHWSRYLDGDIDRDEALTAMVRDLTAHSPRWFVDHVDPSSLAADFYLLEWLTAAGDRTAAARLFRWLPHLCAELAGHLDNVIGNELGHYERARTQHHPQELADFITEINQGDSRVTWQRLRRELGHGRALQLATEAFAGPGIEFGGEAWAPVAAMVRRYVLHELPDRVFVDQCFTLEHNNGSLFDKYHDTSTMREVLDAQAATDLDKLLTHASAEVRELWHGQHRRHRISAEHHPLWLGPPSPAATAPTGPTDRVHRVHCAHRTVRGRHRSIGMGRRRPARKRTRHGRLRRSQRPERIRPFPRPAARLPGASPPHGRPPPLLLLLEDLPSRYRRPAHRARRHPPHATARRSSLYGGQLRRAGHRKPHLDRPPDRSHGRGRFLRRHGIPPPGARFRRPRR